jgi:hypothetical protein
MRRMLKRTSALFLLLGITSSIGAVTKGYDPTGSMTLALWSLASLVLLNSKPNVNSKEESHENA